MNSITVAVVGGAIIIVSLAIYRAWRRARAAALAAGCALFTPSGIIGMFPDECLGTCKRAGTTCTAAGTRSYLIFWKQDIGPCTCVAPPPPPPPPPPGRQGTGGPDGVAPVDHNSRTTR